MKNAKLSGGGIRGNKNVKVGVKYASRTTNVVSPAGVSQIGTAIDPKVVEPVQKGKRPDFAIMGNQKALDVGRGGPGTGRTVYRSGYQALHGKPLPGEKNMAPDIPGASTKGTKISFGNMERRGPTRWHRQRATITTAEKSK